MTYAEFGINRRTARAAVESAALNSEGGITSELVFLESTPTGDFLLLIQDCADVARAMTWFSESRHPLVAHIRNVISEVAEHIELVELLAKFDGRR